MKKFTCIILALCLSFCLVACDININISHNDDKKTSKNASEEKDSNSKKESGAIGIIGGGEGLAGIFKDKEEKQTLIVGTTQFEPYGFQDENGNWTGVEVDILNEVAKKLDMELVFQVCPFESIIHNVSSGHVDIAATALYRTEERMKIANASIDVYPFYIDNDFGVFYTSKDNPELTKAIDDAILVLQENGTIDKILKKYENNPKTNY